MAGKSIKYIPSVIYKKKYLFSSILCEECLAMGVNFMSVDSIYSMKTIIFF